MRSKHGFDTTESRSRLMKKIKSKDSKAEIMLRKALWHLGYRYRKNYRNLKGKPDIVFLKERIAVFIDGEFWHGYGWDKKVIKSNVSYWVKKIERNMQRDIENNATLQEHNWSVIRFWAHQVEKELEQCVKCVQDEINRRRSCSI